MSCSVDGCPNPEAKALLCWGHYKRRQLGKPVNVELETPKTARSPRESLLEACLRFADASADDDGEYASAEQSLLRMADRYGRRLAAERIRAALAERKAKGEPVGRPPTSISPEQLEAVRSGEQRLIDLARATGVHRVTVWRRLQKPR